MSNGVTRRIISICMAILTAILVYNAYVLLFHDNNHYYGRMALCAVATNTVLMFHSWRERIPRDSKENTSSTAGDPDKE